MTSLSHVTSLIAAEEIDRFQRDGFLRIPKVFDSWELDPVENALDALFKRISALPEDVARDLGGAGENSRLRGDLKQPEINKAIYMDRGLITSGIFRKCRQIASEMLNRNARYIFDHAIYKNPNNATATQWHQDQAYVGAHVEMQSIHFWIPFQDVHEDNGCLFYIPGSHQTGLRRHRKINGHVMVAQLHGNKEKDAVACPADRGDLVLHVARTLHYAGPNMSAHPRKAWILHFGPYGRWGYFLPRNLYYSIKSRLYS